MVHMKNHPTLISNDALQRDVSFLMEKNPNCDEIKMKIYK